MVSSLGFLSVALPAVAVAEYTWPSPIDEVENLMYLHQGYVRRGLIDAVNPCGFALTANRGQQEAANWVRTAYHDMATHDAAEGAGGLDASIMFETSRPENPGEGFESTFSFLGTFHNIKASMSDLIAMGVSVAVEACGGPSIPIRGGRVDAVEAGPPGVPEPTESLEVLTGRFAKAGFNVSDMIAMVACGHTLGGVHGLDFPDITGDSSPTSKLNFDTTTDNFDNSVVTEYLNGTTANPLVVTRNDTFNSDKRVFGADGNATMHGMASREQFQATCLDILTRMIDTVPKNVTLSDVIAPIELKPDNLALYLNSDKKLKFSGRIRVRTTNRDADSMSVTVNYKPRSGADCANCTITTTRPTFKGGQSIGFHDTFTWFEFNTILDPSTSISAFTVDVKTAKGSETFTNGGKGFPVQDLILYQQPQSCELQTTDSTTDPFNLTVVAAVRNDHISDPVRFDWVAKVSRKDINVTIPRLEIEPIEMKQWDGTDAGEFYTLFKGEKIMPSEQWSTTFDIVLGDNLGKVDFLPTPQVGVECQPL